MPVKVGRILRALAVAPILLAVLWPYLHGPGASSAGPEDLFPAPSAQAELAAFYASVGIDPGFCEYAPGGDDAGAGAPECSACMLGKLFAAARPDAAAIATPFIAEARAPTVTADTATLEERTSWRRPPGRAPPLTV
jgi:hypothetical protein